jgi:hypothetical protein
MSGSSVVAVSHRALGTMVRLTVREGFSVDLMPEEARTLSRAMAAVRDGKSKVDEIYMSPIACDSDFVAKVLETGLAVNATSGAIHLEWPEVGTLSKSLAEVAG